jgi:hypothetical protein
MLKFLSLEYQLYACGKKLFACLDFEPKSSFCKRLYYYFFTGILSYSNNASPNPRDNAIVLANKPENSNKIFSL